MASLSISCVLTELRQAQDLNKILDKENIDEFSLGDGRISASVYTQLVTPGTHKISDSESDNSGNEHEENINRGFGGVSNKFMWQNPGSFYVVYGP
jgi:hypothetical protein